MLYVLVPTLDWSLPTMVGSLLPIGSRLVYCQLVIQQPQLRLRPVTKKG